MTAKRIMIVEDEAVIAMDLRYHLEAFGYDVVATAVSGAQALERAEASEPDLVMMDIMIKGPFDGIATAEMLQETRRVPVVFLSANSDESTVRRARAAGAYGYLIKPFRPDEVRATIEVALVKAQMETQLRRSEQWFAKTLHCISDGVVATDPEGVVRFLNPVAERLTGWPHEHACGRPVSEVVCTVDETSRQPVDNPLVAALVARELVQSRDTSLLVARTGGEVPVDEGAAPIVDDENQLLGAVLVFRDISRRREAERALRESEERFHSAFDHAAVGIALVAMDGRVLQNNRSVAQLLGYGESELAGINLWRLSQPEDLDAELGALRALVNDEIPAFQMEKRFLRRDGAPVWTLLSVSLVREPDGSPLYCIVQTQDIGARKSAEQRLAQMARQDLLTGLANRAHLIDMAGHALALARRRDDSLGLLFIDLDGFKAINDTLGHKGGDHMLVVTAKRLRACVRDSDIVARWGGDEFVVVTPSASSDESLARVATNILEELSKPVEFAGEESRVTGSIGVAVFPRDGTQVANLVVSADNAMYQAKEMGKNQVCFAGRESAPALLQQTRLESQLRLAVDHGELRLHYQPVVHRGRIDSVEALVRWQHPQQGLLPPGDFIPLAEKSGLILPIGAWVLKTACAQARLWRAGSMPRLRMAVNISARQIRAPDFLSSIVDALAVAQLEPEALELELTESWLMSNFDHSVKMIDGLVSMGVQVTVDDFGTGYSSLAYLKRLRLNRLKIDRSFLAGIPGDSQGEAIVRAIFSLARELGLDIVAEGVETESQQRFLLDLGDLFLQGYRLYRPIAPEVLDQLFAGSASSGGAGDTQ
ncbi:EAL domain-containing protein [Accumulibacter sp.]|uniref:GGDEF domain-containing response regulator n=1 Tax=Accumulibacter sp. TaxID=2053492 RepID=UPI00262FA13B|nr:EAL domain-containing protein [Accumulibacter sp.]